uniref:Gluconate 5-dehydrogenase n=1 Tax=Heterosigma akashiwo TaxID=2829 RepID=A0A7S3YCI8_HETAK
MFGGRLDVLVNNAGANWAAPLEAYPPAAFAKVVGLNLAAPFLLAQTMLPFLSAAASPGNPSRIINIGSIEGLKVSSFETYAYGASKSGLHHLTKMLANKLGPRHITVNAIAPGTFQSKMMRATIQKFGDELVSNVPLGRLGSEEDMAGTSLWLSSRGGAFVTGSVIVVDGGFTVFSSKL